MAICDACKFAILSVLFLQLSGCSASTYSNPNADAGADARLPSFNTSGSFDFDDASVPARARSVLASCAGGPETPCHGIGAGHLQLPDPQDLPNLVNVPATENPTRMRIVPGKPDESYLLWKVRGDAGADSGLVGDRMPQSGPPLEPKYERALYDWIKAGAL